MCGIAGIIGEAAREPATLANMTRAISHRGPDDEGWWTDRECGVALGSRRLAIVDLSPHGHQPMESADGRLVLVFNGEIYNHAELRGELETAGKTPERGWRGHSDTESLLQAISVWGLEHAIEKSVGMFALALWDRTERVLTLVRDRFGEKPLYYGWAGRDFVFGSELKALRAHRRFDNRISRQALTRFAARTYIPAPLSIYEGIFKVPPGCILTVPFDAACRPLDAPPAEGGGQGIQLRRYWSYRSAVEDGLEAPIEDENEALGELEEALARSIQGQSIADVPVGAFLSGGIDSSTVVALYRKYSTQPVRTFSIGFEEAAYNEAGDARAVARKLGTVHEERIVSVAEARDVIPHLPVMYDEPFADSSQIPTYLVSRFAREHVTVALTGDGADELFGGYRRHFFGPRLWRQLSRIPRPLRATGSALGRLPSAFWQGAAELLPGRTQPNAGARIQQALGVAGSANRFEDFCAALFDGWGSDGSPVLGAERANLALDLGVAAIVPDAVRMMYGDAVDYLPDDILAKVDRAAMAVSLETRVPFLDHRVAEIAARIPIGLKVRGGQGKSILRRLLFREVPSDLFDRPKAGFAVPVGDWLKGPLRPWAEELLDASRLGSEGWFDPSKVRRRWTEHLSGRRDSTPAIWSVLMFQSWLDEQRRLLPAAA